MPDSEAFETVCADLERETALDRLEARGTVRLVLKEAGLDARSVTPAHLGVAVTRILPRELQARGIADAEALCERLRARLATLRTGPATDSPDAVFERLGGGAC